MGLINREKDLTEQRELYGDQTGVIGISLLIQLGTIPYSGVIEKVVSAAYGLSGSPIMGLQIQRFIVGSGNTTIPLNGSSLLTILAYSTSGLQTHVLPAVSSTLVQVISGDQVQAVTSVANTAATYNISMVVRCLQDFKTQFTLGSGA